MFLNWAGGSGYGVPMSCGSESVPCRGMRKVLKSTALPLPGLCSWPWSKSEAFDQNQNPPSVNSLAFDTQHTNLLFLPSFPVAGKGMLCIRRDYFSKAQALGSLSPGITVEVHQHPPRQALTGHLARWPAHLEGGCCNLGSPSWVSRGVFISSAPHINLGRLRGCWSLPANASGCKVLFPREQNTRWLSSRVFYASLRHPEDVQGGRQAAISWLWHNGRWLFARM